jgi:hypothetical protein
MINLTPVEKFLKAVRTAKDYNSKEIRLTISEADALSDCVSTMLLQDRALTERIMQLQDQLLQVKDAATPVSGGMQLNGGSF